MDKVKIIWLPVISSSIGQVYSSGLQLAFASPKLEQCHDFVYCKDFLQDALWGWYNNKQATIFSFKYDKKKQPPLSLDRTRLLVVNHQDKDFRNKVQNSLDLINQFCARMKLKKTKLYEAENSGKHKTGAFLFVGSERWMNAPPMISMFSLLIRAGCVHVKGNDCMDTLNKIANGELPKYQQSDQYQVKGAIPAIEKILKWGYRKWFYKENNKNYPSTASVSYIHGAGVCGLASKSTSGVCSYWTRKLKKIKNKGDNYVI